MLPSLDEVTLSFNSIYGVMTTSHSGLDQLQSDKSSILQIL